MSADRPRRMVGGPAVLAALLGLLTSCSVVSQPDAKSWDTQVRTALEDTASEVATARLALKSAAEDRVWSPYALVLLTEAEKSAVTLRSDLASVQAPPSRQRRAEDVLDLLDYATDAVREAREAAVEKRYDAPALVAKLTKLRVVLQQASRAE